MTLDFQPEHIIVSHADRILRISLNRPEKRNAITGRMLAEIICVLELASGDPEVRVIVIQGAGKGFCQGMILAVWVMSPRHCCNVLLFR